MRSFSREILRRGKYPEEDTSDKEASGDSASDSASPENSKTQDPASEEENASDDPSSAGSADDPSEEPASSEESSEETYEDDTSGAVYAFEDAMYSEWNDDFSDIRSFIEYEVLDGTGLLWTPTSL